MDVQLLDGAVTGGAALGPAKCMTSTFLVTTWVKIVDQARNSTRNKKRASNLGTVAQVLDGLGTVMQECVSNSP
uniref:Uncharacterized protein n=1 Tax=Anatid alphaherpesvirus 2 TaxID=3080522 RepID=A0AAU0K868_9ALPH